MSGDYNIVVCIKQVPETTEVNFDEETGRLIREGVAAVINPFDEYAIEEGIRIKEKHGGTVKVLTMGPPWAADALRDAIAMGADEAYLATDRAFAGADTWATSLTLAKTIEKMGDYDIIICGLKTTDGDTGQTGPEMAEHMDIPHVCYVSEIVEVNEGTVILKRNLDNGVETFVFGERLHTSLPRGLCERAESLSREVFCLPVHQDLDREQLRFVARIVREAAPREPQHAQVAP